MTHTTKQVFAVVAIAAASLLSAGTVFAQEATPDNWTSSATSSLSRAEVQAELTSARRGGQADVFSTGYLEPSHTKALRAEVRADTLQAIASGELEAINARVHSFKPEAAQRVALLIR